MKSRVLLVVLAIVLNSQAFALKSESAQDGKRTKSSIANSVTQQSTKRVRPDNKLDTKPADYDANRYNLELTLNELPDGNVELQVTNTGSGPFNLEQFSFSVSGHQIGRPIQTRFIEMNGTLQPNESSSDTFFFQYAYCNTFTRYTADASGMNKIIETTMEVSPADVTLNGLSLVPHISNGVIDEDSSLDIILSVSNNSDRTLKRCFLEGVFSVSAGNEYQFYRIDMLVGEIEAGRSNKTVTLDLGSTNFENIRACSPTALWDVRPELFGIQARLRSDKDCGLIVYFGRIHTVGMRLE